MLCPIHSVLTLQYELFVWRYSERNQSCNDARIQRGGGGGWVGWTGGPDPPLKNHKFIKFLRNTSPDLLKSHKATSIQCWAIIGPLAEHHLNGV